MKNAKLNLNELFDSDNYYFVCPKCKCLSSKVIPYYKNMFDGNAFGYFLLCCHCETKSFLQVVTVED